MSANDDRASLSHALSFVHRQLDPSLQVHRLGSSRVRCAPSLSRATHKLERSEQIEAFRY